jgi:hypothetical protein
MSGSIARYRTEAKSGHRKPGVIRSAGGCGDSLSAEAGPHWRNGSAYKGLLEEKRSCCAGVKSGIASLIGCDADTVTLHASGGGELILRSPPLCARKGQTDYNGRCFTKALRFRRGVSAETSVVPYGSKQSLPEVFVRQDEISTRRERSVRTLNCSPQSHRRLYPRPSGMMPSKLAYSSG